MSQSDMWNDSILVKGQALKEIIAQYFGVGYKNVILNQYSATIIEPQIHDPRKSTATADKH